MIDLGSNHSRRDMKPVANSQKLVQSERGILDIHGVLSQKSEFFSFSIIHYFDMREGVRRKLTQSCQICK
jgi:hypothetical protein